MLDCLLYEGSTVLYRMALGILSRNETTLKQCATEEEFLEAVKDAAKTELEADPLFKACWKFKVKHEHLVELYNAIVEEGALQDVPELEMESIRLPNPADISIPSLENVIHRTIGCSN